MDPPLWAQSGAPPAAPPPPPPPAPWVVGAEWRTPSSPSLSPPPGTCDEWRSASPLGVGLASRLGDPASSLLAPHRVHCNKDLVVLCVESTTQSSMHTRTRRSSHLHSVALKHQQGQTLGPREYRELLRLVDQGLY